MSFAIRLLPAVHKDLRVDKKWYNDQKADLGEEFKAEVNKEIDFIIDNLGVIGKNTKNCGNL